MALFIPHHIKVLHRFIQREKKKSRRVYMGSKMCNAMYWKQNLFPVAGKQIYLLKTLLQSRYPLCEGPVLHSLKLMPCFSTRLKTKTKQNKNPAWNLRILFEVSQAKRILLPRLVKGQTSDCSNFYVLQANSGSFQTFLITTPHIN